MAPTKLLIVQSEHMAKYCQKLLGEDWFCIGVGGVLAGRHFELILVSEWALYGPHTIDSERVKNEQWVNSTVKLKLKDKKTSVILFV